MHSILFWLRLYGTSRDELLIRVIARGDAESFYLSCWQKLSHLRTVSSQSTMEPLENYEQRNWQTDLETADVERWLELLQFQTVVLAPPKPDASQGRSFGGSLYQFGFEAYPGTRLQLEWSDPVPPQWEAIEPVTQWLQQRAEASKPTDF